MNSVKQYLEKMTPDRNNQISVLEQFAYKHKIPIMEQVSMNFLTQLIRIQKPQSILEIGTAIGYSALRMHEALPLAEITTIEKDEKMYSLAVENIRRQNKDPYINVLHGDALELIKKLVIQKKQFDFIFIDAAKGQYKRFFELVQPCIAPEGMIVCDNVLFKGYVINKEVEQPNRLQKLARKIHDFNEWLVKLENYHTSIIPIGDGISISVKIK